MEIAELRQQLSASQEEVASLQQAAAYASPSPTLSYAPAISAKHQNEFEASSLASPRLALPSSTSASRSAPSRSPRTPTQLSAKSPKAEAFGWPLPPPSPSATQTSAVATPTIRQAGSDVWVCAFRLDLQRAIDENRCRELSLKACTDFIDKLYESKASAAAKYLQQGPLSVGIPVETMEMHMYRILEKKYGLRTIAAEHAGMILQTVDKYCDKDIYINVFQKVFRNEINEDYWLVLRDLKDKIRDMTLVHIMGRNPTKDQVTVAKLLEIKMTEGFVTEDEWKDMISFLYNNTDSSTIYARLQRLARDEMLLSNSGGESVASHFSASRQFIGEDGDLSVLSSPSALQGSVGLQNSSRRRGTGAEGYVGFSTSPSHANATVSALVSPPSVRSLGTSARSKSPSSASVRTTATSSTFNLTANDKARHHPKAQLKLSFPAFLRCVLEFQLRSHVQFLSTFRHCFQVQDTDRDGILSTVEFQACFHSLRRGLVKGSTYGLPPPPPGSPRHNISSASPAFRFPSSNSAVSVSSGDVTHSRVLSNIADAGHENDVGNADAEAFLVLLGMVDPLQSDMITFSNAASCLRNVVS